MSLRLIGLLAALTVIANAQDFRATLQGTVTDPQAASVGNATITVRNTETGVERTVTTTEDGFYSFPYLLAGTYSLSVKSAGFRTEVRDKITLNVSQVLREDVALTIGRSQRDDPCGGQRGYHRNRQHVIGDGDPDRNPRQPPPQGTEFAVHVHADTGCGEQPVR